MPDTTPRPNDRFGPCLAAVLAQEGGYSDHPRDPGGATQMGITRRTLAAWRRVRPWWKLPKAAVRTLGRAEAERIYEALYWVPCRAGRMPPGLDLALFDFAVNSGPGRAVRSLQRLLAVTEDGRVGPRTLAALEASLSRNGAAPVIDRLCAARLGFLRRLLNWASFGRGWTRRIAAIRAAALEMAGTDPARDFTKRRETMEFLAGYKTYIIAAAMLVAGAAQLLGVDLPALEGQSAGHLVMEALAIIFLRRGIANDIGKA